MIHIAVISSSEFIAQIDVIGQQFPNVVMHRYLYAQPADAYDLMDEVRDMDVLLFAGPLPYYFAKPKIDQMQVPAVYIPSDEYTVAQSLLHLICNEQRALEHISIDIHKAAYLNDVVDELNIDISNWFVKDCSHMLTAENIHFDLEEIFSFHVELWKEGRTQFAITNVDYIYTRLQALGVPCSYLIVPAKAIRDTFTKAITYNELAASKHAELAIGLIIFHDKNSSYGDFNGMDADVSLTMQRLLLDLATQTETSIRLVGMDQFVLYGTRGSIDYMVMNGLIEQLFADISACSNIVASIGIGYGITAKEAEGNARSALYHARQQPDCAVYIASSEKEVFSPAADSAPFLLKSEKASILEVADRTNLSITTVTRLKQFTTLHREQSFTANDLASAMSLSRRSAERLIKKLAESSYIQKVGEEQPYQSGRPRAVYRIQWH